MPKNTNRTIVMAAMMVATFLASIEGTVVSTAMPSIVGDLNGVSLMNWVFSIYFLSSAVTVPIFGKLSDLFGRKKLFVIGTFIFLLGSILCGLSQSMEQLIAFRVIQGIGAGALLPVTATIVADIYPFEKRAKMMGYINLVWGVSSVVGPLIGGFFVDFLTWHLIFFINIPFGITTVIMVTIFFKEEVEKTKKKIDFVGAFTFSAGMFLLLYAFQKGGESGQWTSPMTVLFFSLAVILLTLFVWVESKVEEPIIPLYLFRIRTISVANAVGFFVTVILIGMTVYMPMWIQSVLGFSATISGLIIAPKSILWTVGSFYSNRLLLRKGIKFTSVVGTSFLLLGSLLLATVNVSSPLMMFSLISALLGIAFGLVLTITTVAVQSAVGWSLRGVATASNTFFRNMGQTIGAAVLGTLFNMKTSSTLIGEENDNNINVEQLNELVNPHSTQQLDVDIRDSLQEVLVSGLSTVFVTFTVVSLLALLIALWLPSQNHGNVVSETRNEKVSI